MVRIVALALAAALALPALADDSVVPPAPVDAAVIESAQLDPAALEQGASLELFGLSSTATTALIFVVVAITVVALTENGDSEGIPP